MKLGRGTLARAAGGVASALVASALLWSFGAFDALGGLTALVFGLLAFSLLQMRQLARRSAREHSALRAALAQEQSRAASEATLLRQELARADERTVGLLHRSFDAQRSLEQRSEQLAATLEAVRAESQKAFADLMRSNHSRATGSRRELRNLFHQVEGALDLRMLRTLSRPLPRSGGWAASSDLLSVLVRIIEQRRPSTIVECGSGLSTLVLASAMAEYGLEGRVIALEHDAGFRERTLRTIASHGLERFVDVREAELRTQTVGGRETIWYDQDAWADLDGIDLLFIDGPPASTGTWARWPALPAFRDRLSSGCLLVLDDTIRTDEKEVVGDWLRLFPEFQEADLKLEKGCVALFGREDEMPLGLI